MSRTLREIAREIRTDWPKAMETGTNFWGETDQPLHPAGPYLRAMSTLDSLEDRYFHDPASSVVRYFLSNATTWKGETARRVKAELKAMLAEHDKGLTAKYGR